jgi:hypothetical protein
MGTAVTKLYADSPVVCEFNFSLVSVITDNNWAFRNGNGGKKQVELKANADNGFMTFIGVT